MIQAESSASQQRAEKRDTKGKQVKWAPTKFPVLQAREREHTIRSGMSWSRVSFASVLVLLSDTRPGPRSIPFKMVNYGGGEYPCS